MRELTKKEIQQVSGGNLPATIGGIALAWDIGTSIGRTINRYNASQGRSFGKALFKATH